MQCTNGASICDHVPLWETCLPFSAWRWHVSAPAHGAQVPNLWAAQNRQKICIIQPTSHKTDSRLWIRCTAMAYFILHRHWQWISDEFEVWTETEPPGGIKLHLVWCSDRFLDRMHGQVDHFLNLLNNATWRRNRTLAALQKTRTFASLIIRTTIDNALILKGKSSKTNSEVVYKPWQALMLTNSNILQPRCTVS